MFDGFLADFFLLNRIHRHKDDHKWLKINF